MYSVFLINPVVTVVIARLYFTIALILTEVVPINSSHGVVGTLPRGAAGVSVSTASTSFYFNNHKSC